MDDLYLSLNQIKKDTIVICNMGYLAKEKIYKQLYENKIKFGFYLLDATPKLIRDIHYFYKKEENRHYLY